MRPAGTKAASIMLQIVLAGRFAEAASRYADEGVRRASENGRAAPKTTAVSRQMRGTGTGSPTKSEHVLQKKWHAGTSCLFILHL
ncbi:unnamed protein product, partial [Iphiclides podalirius]